MPKRFLIAVWSIIALAGCRAAGASLPLQAPAPNSADLAQATRSPARREALASSPETALPVAGATPELPAPFPSLAPSAGPSPTRALGPAPIDLGHELIPFVSNRPEGAGGYDVMIFDRTAKTVFVPPGANTRGDEFNPSLTHDNHWLIYNTTVHRNADIWLFDMQSQLVDTLPTLNTPEDDLSPTVSGDGSVIAYTSHEHGHDRLHLFDLRTGTNLVPAAVMRMGSDIANPAISPDGLWVAFSTLLANQSRDIFLYDVAHARVVEPPYLNTGATQDEPAWSPDGRELAFSTTRNGHQDVTVYDLASHATDRLPLANSASDDLTPSFLGTTDQQIVFVSDRTGKDDRRLYVYARASGILDTLPTAHDLGRIDTFSPP